MNSASISAMKEQDRAGSLVARAWAMAAEGRALDAVDLLTRENRNQAEPALEIELVGLRARAFEELKRLNMETLRAGEASPAPDDAPPPASPKLATNELTAQHLRAAIGRFGYAHVTDFLTQQECAAFRHVIDEAFEARDGGARERPSSYAPFDAPGGAFSGKRDRPMRIWVADTPRLLFEYLEFVRASGLADVIADFLGERPAISVNKTSARRVKPYPTEAGWHQDGRFLGSSIRTLNVWLALSDCGRAAPGMEILPKRLDYIVETGTEGAPLDWTVANDKVLEAGSGVRPETPDVKAGDMFLFDHYFLHRTNSAAPPGSVRYAIECWYFAPSAYPEKGQFPLAF